MRRSRWLIAGAAGVGGLIAVRAVAGRTNAPARSNHAVTVFRPLDYVTANMPPALTDHADAIEAELCEAPGGRGTEIHVRRTSGAVSDDEIRATLRIARSQLEVGDVLRPGVATTRPTVLNRALRGVTSRGRKKGLL